jgi:hypothetical protein
MLCGMKDVPLVLGYHVRKILRIILGDGGATDTPLDRRIVEELEQNAAANARARHHPSQSNRRIVDEGDADVAGSPHHGYDSETRHPVHDHLHDDDDGVATASSSTRNRG